MHAYIHTFINDVWTDRPFFSSVAASYLLWWASCSFAWKRLQLFRFNLHSDLRTRRRFSISCSDCAQTTFHSPSRLLLVGKLVTLLCLWSQLALLWTNLRVSLIRLQSVVAFWFQHFLCVHARYCFTDCPTFVLRAIILQVEQNRGIGLEA